MGNMEEENVDLLNIEQEDDNLLGVSPTLLSLGPSPLLSLGPSIMPKALKQASPEDLENCYGEKGARGASGVVEAVLEVKIPPVAPSAVLTVLNFNEMNKRKVEEPWFRKGCETKESMQLDGIAETSPVKKLGNITSQLSRSYLDVENEKAGTTPEKGGEPTVFRKSRSRRSTALRKSLAWDKAFFTDEGVLDNDELFAVASDAPQTLPMPELATIWDGPQSVIAPFEARSTPLKTRVKPESIPEESRTEVRPESLRAEVIPAVEPKPQQDVLLTTLRPDALHTTSVRPLRQIHTTGSHAFSNAYSRAAAIPQGSTSIPLPNGLSRAGKQLGGAGQHPTEHVHRTATDIKESRSTAAGLHHQARIAALKKAHEAPAQRGPRVRLPTSISSKKVEGKHLEETTKMKPNKKVEDKHSEEVHMMHATREKQVKKVEHKPSEAVHKMHKTREKQVKKVEDKPSNAVLKTSATREKQPALTRSTSTPSLLESPSALSRKVSFMSKKVKETLGRVMSGRARRVPKESSLSHVHPLEKPSTLAKKSGVLLTVPEVRVPIHRAGANAVLVPVKANKEIYTVRDILRGKGPPSAPKEAPKEAPRHGLSLLRSKSATVPGLTRRIDPGLARVAAPCAPPPPPPVQPSEPVGKPTGLRKPSPKLGFFDSGRASSAPQNASATSQPIHGTQPARLGSKASVPSAFRAHRSQVPVPVHNSSAIPSAPHLRHGVESAPTSPRSIHVMPPSSRNCSSAASTRPSSPSIESVEPPVNFSGIRYAEQFAESHQLLAKRMLKRGGSRTACAAPRVSALDSFKLPEALSPSTEVDAEPAEVSRGGLVISSAERNLSIPPAVGRGGLACCGSELESGGGEAGNNIVVHHADLLGLQASERPDECGQAHSERCGHLDTTVDHSSSPVLGSTKHACESQTSSESGPIGSVCSDNPAHTGDGRIPQGSPQCPSLLGSTNSDDKSSAHVRQCSQGSGPELKGLHGLDKRPVWETLSPSSQDGGSDHTVSEAFNMENGASVDEATKGSRESSVVSNGLMCSLLELPVGLRSSSGNRPDEITRTSGFGCDSPRSRSCREMCSTGVTSREHTDNATRDSDPPPACPSTPTSKERSHGVCANVGRHFEFPRSKSFREVSTRTSTSSDSPVAASKHVRSLSQRQPWQSPSGKAGGDASPSFGPSTPISASKRHSFVSPSHASGAAGTFEVLTPTSSRNVPCVRTPGSSGKKASRKIVEIESPTSHWCDWPVLGAAISEEQVAGSGKKNEGLRSEPPIPSRDQATEQPTALRPDSSAGALSTPSVTERRAELDTRPAMEKCVLASEQSSDSGLSLTGGVISAPTNIVATTDTVSGSIDRAPLLGLNGSEACGSAKKGSSVLSFARKAVARMTMSPAGLPGQENEGSPRARKISRRFSRSGSNSCPPTEPKPLSPFSEARICELEAAGPEVLQEILQKKTGPVQNSPPDKVVVDANPWSPVRKNRQPLGPFDCTKLKYISPGLTAS